MLSRSDTAESICAGDLGKSGTSPAMPANTRALESGRAEWVYPQTLVVASLAVMFFALLSSRCLSRSREAIPAVTAFR
jgi:hypothetical protein